MPGRECIKKPPIPARRSDCSCSIKRAMSRRSFHDQKGMGRNSAGGLQKTSRSRGMAVHSFDVKPSVGYYIDVVICVMQFSLFRDIPTNECGQFSCRPIDGESNGNPSCIDGLSPVAGPRPSRCRIKSRDMGRRETWLLSKTWPGLPGCPSAPFPMSSTGERIYPSVPPLGCEGRWSSWIIVPTGWPAP